MAIITPAITPPPSKLPFAAAPVNTAGAPADVLDAPAVIAVVVIPLDSTIVSVKAEFRGAVTVPVVVEVDIAVGAICSLASQLLIIAEGGGLREDLRTNTVVVAIAVLVLEDVIVLVLVPLPVAPEAVSTLTKLLI